MVKALTSLIGLIFFGCLWLISIPCTLLVIIFDFAKENSEWLYSLSDEPEQKIDELRIALERQNKTFMEKLSERMKETEAARKAGLNERKKL